MEILPPVEVFQVHQNLFIKSFVFTYIPCLVDGRLPVDGKQCTTVPRYILMCCLCNVQNGHQVWDQLLIFHVKHSLIDRSPFSSSSALTHRQC